MHRLDYFRVRQRLHGDQSIEGPGSVGGRYGFLLATRNGSRNERDRSRTTRLAGSSVRASRLGAGAFTAGRNTGCRDCFSQERQKFNNLYALAAAKSEESLCSFDKFS
jgi:hypothetical protein